MEIDHLSECSQTWSDVEHRVRWDDNRIGIACSLLTAYLSHQWTIQSDKVKSEPIDEVKPEPIVSGNDIVTVTPLPKVCLLFIIPFYVYTDKENICVCISVVIYIHNKVFSHSYRQFCDCSDFLCMYMYVAMIFMFSLAAARNFWYVCYG